MEANPSTHWHIWQAAMEGNTLEKVCRELAGCQDKRLPWLKRNRTVSSWRNGMWFAERQYFHLYTKQQLPSSCISAVFIDEDFNIHHHPSGDFMDTDCTIKNILIDQGYSKSDVCFILGVCFGRLIFTPGKFDRWEIIPYLWGELHQVKVRV